MSDAARCAMRNLASETDVIEDPDHTSADCGPAVFRTRDLRSAWPSHSRCLPSTGVSAGNPDGGQYPMLTERTGFCTPTAARRGRCGASARRRRWGRRHAPRPPRRRRSCAGPYSPRNRRPAARPAHPPTKSGAMAQAPAAVSPIVPLPASSSTRPPIANAIPKKPAMPHQGCASSQWSMSCPPSRAREGDRARHPMDALLGG